MRRVFILGRILMILNAIVLFGSVLFYHAHDPQATDALTRQTAICVALVLGMLGVQDWPKSPAALDPPPPNPGLCLQQIANLWSVFDREGFGMSASEILYRLEEREPSDSGVIIYKHAIMRCAFLEWCPGSNGRLPSSMALAGKLGAIQGRRVSRFYLTARRRPDGLLAWSFIPLT